MNVSLLNMLFGASLLATCLVFTGCQTSVNTVSREPPAQRQMVTDKRVITDAGLGRKVYVIGVAEAPTPGGMLQIQVEVWNRTGSAQRFNYWFEWFDSNGMQVNPTSTAKIPCLLEGGETRLLSSVAPTPLCKDFRVKFMEAKN
jgi:uncharacterized protein YcfL